MVQQFTLYLMISNEIDVSCFGQGSLSYREFDTTKLNVLFTTNLLSSYSCFPNSFTSDYFLDSTSTTKSITTTTVPRSFSNCCSSSNSFLECLSQLFSSQDCCYCCCSKCLNCCCWCVKGFDQLLGDFVDKHC